MDNPDNINNPDDLENLRRINKKAKLIQELMSQIALDVSKFSNGEEMLSLPVNDQISIIYAAFISLFYHYKLNMAEIINVTTEEEIARAQEIIKLEDSLNSVDPNTIERYINNSGVWEWEIVERKVIKAGDLVRGVGIEGSERYAVKDAFLYQNEWYIELDSEFS